MDPMVNPKLAPQLQHSLPHSSISLPEPATFVDQLIPLKPIRKVSLQSLPNELLFQIFSFLELKPYIICHGVCMEWHRLLPSTQMHPIRERLLNLYYCIIHTPGFEKTLEWSDKKLQPFDREDYIRCLLAQYPAIPEEFRMWILEWPARLVIQGLWPGLPFVNCNTVSLSRPRSGVNWIAYRPFSPRLSSLVVSKRRRRTHTLIPGLYIWNEATLFEWLIFGLEKPDLFGQVLHLEGPEHTPGTIPYDRLSKEDTDSDPDSDSELSDDDQFVFTTKDWIYYLEEGWSQTSEEIPREDKPYLAPDITVQQPVRYSFGDIHYDILPAPMWDTCKNTKVLNVE